MKIVVRILVLLVIFISSSIVKNAIGAIIQDGWDSPNSYRPIPVTFIHGANGRPGDWGFRINDATENVTGYEDDRTAKILLPYFNKYYDFSVDPNVELPYIEPFNYRYNTFDRIEWNAYEGYEKEGIRHPGEQYPDERIKELAPQVARPVLRVSLEGGDIANVSGAPVNIGGILSKYQASRAKLVAHSLGGVVSRWYIYKTGTDASTKVDKLVTLASPHNGWEWARLINWVFREPVREWTPGFWRVLGVFILHRVISELPLDRDPYLVEQMIVGNTFLNGINANPPALFSKPSYYCIAGSLHDPREYAFPNVTDGIVALRSAWAVKEVWKHPKWPDGTTTPVSKTGETVEPDSYLPNYTNEMLKEDEGKDWVNQSTSGIDWQATCAHGIMPRIRWQAILRAIDDVAPVIEFTQLKDSNNDTIWSPGQEYFDIPENGIVKVHGLCRKEYLPADTYINIGFKKTGWIDIRWVATEQGGTTTDQTQAWKYFLKPSDAWNASNPDSPVAEFEVDITFPENDMTNSIVVQATNSAGKKSDMIYLTQGPSGYFVLADNNRIYFVDAKKALGDGAISNAIQFEFNPVDENYNQITEDINGLDSMYYCYNNKIRVYDINGYPTYVTGSRYERSTDTHIPQSIEGNSQFIEGNKKWSLDSNDNVTEVDKIWNFSPPETWVEDAGFSGKGLYDGYVISSNKLKRFGQNDYGIWDFNLGFTGTGLSFRNRTKTGYTGLFYGTDGSNIYEFEIKNPSAYYLINGSGNISSQARVVEETNDYFNGEISLHDVINNIIRTARFKNPVEDYKVRARYFFSLDLSSISDTALIKWAYRKVSSISFYKYQQRWDYYIQRISEYNHLGAILSKFDGDINSDILTLLNLGPGESIQIVEYSPQYISSVTVSFEQIDITSYLIFGQKNLFGVIYSTENVELPTDYPLWAGTFHTILNGENLMSANDISLLIQSPEQEGSLDILRTVSTEGLNINAIGIVQPGQVPGMQIRSDSSVNVGGAIQLRTVGVLPITWSVSDNTKATVDSNGLLAGREVGTITVTATDAVGQIATKQITVGL